MLVAHGAKLDIYDASAVGNLDGVRSADPKQINTRSSDGATPLGLACFFGHLDVAIYLLDHGAEIDTLQTNPAFPFVALHSAMSGGQRPIFDLLLSRGASVNVREGGGLTILHEAAGLGDRSYVETL